MNRLVDMLIEAITNVRRELKFFEDVAGRYGLKLEAQEVGKGVKMYRALFNAVGEGVEKGERGVIDGLVLLWGTEKVGLFYFSSLLSLSLGLGMVQMGKS
jgi:hypothetical protein